MDPCILHTWAGRLARWSWLPVCLLVLTAGCDGSKTKYETAEVSGKVLFNKKGLPGGRITFVADEGGLAQTATIDENGNYKIMAPVGQCHITVDNRSLEKRATKGPILQRPDQEDPSAIKGTYVAIPKKFYSADQSDLTFKVESGAAQSHDVSLD